MFPFLQDTHHENHIHSSGIHPGGTPCRHRHHGGFDRPDHSGRTVGSCSGKTDHLQVSPTLTDTRHADSRSIYFGVDDFKNLIKHCDATLTLTKTEDSNAQRLTIVTHCKFGWFFNLFISRKMYRNTVEWRIEQFLENLRCTVEKKPLRQVKIELE